VYGAQALWLALRRPSSAPACRTDRCGPCTGSGAAWRAMWRGARAMPGSASSTSVIATPTGSRKYVQERENALDGRASLPQTVPLRLQQHRTFR
jgi:hypothetical protein